MCCWSIQTSCWLAANVKDTIDPNHTQIYLRTSCAQSCASLSVESSIPIFLLLQGTWMATVSRTCWMEVVECVGGSGAHIHNVCEKECVAGQSVRLVWLESLSSPGG